MERYDKLTKKHKWRPELARCCWINWPFPHPFPSIASAPWEDREVSNRGKMRFQCSVIGQRENRAVKLGFFLDLDVFYPFSGQILDFPEKSVSELAMRKSVFWSKEILWNFLIDFLVFDQWLFFSSIFFRVIRNHLISGAIGHAISFRPLFCCEVLGINASRVSLRPSYTIWAMHLHHQARDVSEFEILHRCVLLESLSNHVYWFWLQRMTTREFLMNPSAGSFKVRRRDRQSPFNEWDSHSGGAAQQWRPQGISIGWPRSFVGKSEASFGDSLTSAAWLLCFAKNFDSDVLDFRNGQTRNLATAW
jgi:hypothetical protein